MNYIQSIATVFNAEVQQEKGHFPRVQIYADVELLKCGDVKSIDVNAIKVGLQNLLGSGLVEFVQRSTTTSEKNPPVSKK